MEVLQYIHPSIASICVLGPEIGGPRLGLPRSTRPLVSAAAVPSLGRGEAVYYAFNDLSDWKGREYTNPADIFASTLGSR